MEKIEKLDDSRTFGFNKKELEKQIRTLRLKINEIIDVVNELMEPPYTDDLDDDEDEEGFLIDVEDVNISKSKKKMR